MEFKVSNRVRLLRLLLISHSAVIVLLQGGHGYSFCAPTLLLSLLPVGHSLSEGPVRSELKSKNAFSVEPWMFLLMCPGGLYRFSVKCRFFIGWTHFIIREAESMFL